MYLPPPLPPQNASDPPAVVRVLTREEIHWNRPLFKAPPLDVPVPSEDIFAFVQNRLQERRLR